MLPYAELHCISNFSFLRGASHPEELVDRAHALGYAALALTDECSLAGVVRAHLQARCTGLRLLVGSEFRLTADVDTDGVPGTPRAADAPPLEGGERLVLIARDRDGYGDLSSLISAARRRAAKGGYRLSPMHLDGGLPGCVALWVPRPGARAGTVAEQARWLAARFPGRCWIAVELLLRGGDAAWLETLRQAGALTGVPLVAAGDVAFHLRSRKPLHDTLAAIRLGTSLDRAGLALAPNAEQHLRHRLRLARLHPPDLLARTLDVAALCRFSLDELRYEYPEEIVPPGHTPASWLRALVEEGALRRHPDGLPPPVRAQLEHELALIAELRYEPYFLTVADIVAFARARGILCQGRGSAANSVVCWCLGITEVDPGRVVLLFERFLSRERREPPDIDIDFEHQRREEVIQYLYAKYGRHRAALAASVVRYRARSAARDTGRALGLDPRRVERLTRLHQWWDGHGLHPDRLREAGFDPDSPLVTRWTRLAATLAGFPRHLSQHTGGFVIARDDLTRLVPVENAAMPARTVIQWDKDDLETLGLLKVDVLGLGMLSVIRRALEFAGLRRGLRDADGRPVPLRMQDIPDGDEATYAMLREADTIGVFQVESRAQMTMLPRLRPACYYDLVVQVAIVRPGPIQGGMVHPYLRRRQGLEPESYPRESLRPALERTRGVPIFQEQVMQIAMLAAGFTPGEADALRRAMAAWRRRGGLEVFEARLIDGMVARGYERAFAEGIFRQIQGFGEYGFPESHAASFALLVYVSAWLKRHEPAAFLAALLDSQPMGFYAPAQLVRDARAHGVEVRPVDVLRSGPGCTLESFPDDGAPPSGERGAEAAHGEASPAARGLAPAPGEPAPLPRAFVAACGPAVRLGLSSVRGLSAGGIARLCAARAHGPFEDVRDLARRAALDARDLRALAAADALAPLAGHRRQASWLVAEPPPRPDLLRDADATGAAVTLPAPSEWETIMADHAALGLSLGRHPLALLRERLDALGVRTAASLRDCPHGRLVRASGLVTHRQRPETANGTLFVTLEDDTGIVNVIVRDSLLARQRAPLLQARLLTVQGRWQRDPDSDRVTHLVARRVHDHSALLGGLAGRSRDFR